MRVLFTGGGTGGHVYPALAVVQELRRRTALGDAPVEIGWVGRRASIEEQIVRREGIPYLAVRTGALRGRSPLQAVRSIVNLLLGVVQSWWLLGRWRADTVFSTGGYVTAPLTLAAWLRRVPVMIYLPDMEPGMAVRRLARYARRIAVSFEPVAAQFDPSRVFVSGYPVRPELFTTERAPARKRLGLDAAQPVLLVLGGSSGARSVNHAVGARLEALLEIAQVVHISGPADHAELEQRAAALSREQRARYRLFEYLHEEMADALAAADLVVARAGAATLAEFPAVRVPAILVPYPYAGQHQEVNARYLADRGGAVVLADAEVARELVNTVASLLGDGPRLARMAQAMGRLSMPDAPARLADELLKMGGGGGDG